VEVMAVAVSACGDMVLGLLVCYDTLRSQRWKGWKGWIYVYGNG
jgi:hypothetical protein